jgi:hypothetical protein
METQRCKRYLSILVICFCSIYSNGQIPEKTVSRIPDAFCVSSMEYKLYTMINSYRKRYDLPPIPLSKSLCFVASTHVKDLFFHHPDKGKCNAHSWSNQGFWKPFCYPGDENKNGSVWDKPKELTPYKAKGIEIVYYENDATVIDSIIAFWKSMDYFNSFLMNTGKWQGKKWNAIGIGIHENYACAWFGEAIDPEGEPVICGQEPTTSVIPSGEDTSGEVEMPAVKVTEKPATVKKPVEKIPPPIPKPAEKAEKAKTSLDKPLSGQERYYIIVKGAAPAKEIKQLLNDLKAKGYSTARLMDKDGKQRISIMDFADKIKADSALRQFRKTWQDAWILKQ